MFQDAFIKLTADEAAKILEEVNPVLEGGNFDPVTATVMSQDLSFYPGYSFLDIANYETTPHFRKFVIYKPGNVMPLDWTNGPLYALNDNVPLGLTGETLFEYVRFFFNCVRGPHGKFILVETVEDIPWREDPPPSARKAVGQLLDTLEITDMRDDGGFNMKATLVFKNALYRARLDISKNGRITMDEEEILLDDLPVLDDTLGQ